jgi:hypothetical protein
VFEQANLADPAEPLSMIGDGLAALERRYDAFIGVCAIDLDTRRAADRGSCSDADTEHNVGADDPLTTKKGWRRFVDHQSQPPGLRAAELSRLSPGERADYDEARRGYHADLPVVNTPTIQNVISTSRLLVQLNRNQVSACRGVIISGASGTGKTTALTQWAAPTNGIPASGIPPIGTGSRSSTSPCHRLRRRGCWPWSSPAFWAWSSPAEQISPTSSTRSAPPPQTRVSSWSASMSCTT